MDSYSLSMESVFFGPTVSSGTQVEVDVVVSALSRLTGRDHHDTM